MMRLILWYLHRKGFLVINKEAATRLFAVSEWAHIVVQNESGRSQEASIRALGFATSHLLFTSRNQLVLNNDELPIKA